MLYLSFIYENLPVFKIILIPFKNLQYYKYILYIYILNVSEFLIHGIAYTFAIEPGKISRGIATAHSAPPLNKKIISEKDIYVWPYLKGNLRGQSIEPLMKHVPEIVQHDKSLYEILALIDAIRVGRTREKEIAAKLLQEKLQYYAGRYYEFSFRK